MNSRRISRRKSVSSVPPSLPRRVSSRTDRNSGLRLLAAGKEPVIADFIAVHGLNGHRDKTWSTASGVNWLESILPKDIPNVRILTYGYNARTHGSEPFIAESLYDHGKTLVEVLCVDRRRTKTEGRPIVFLAHSLGGLVVKAALTHSNLHGRDNSLNDIKLSAYGLVFFGTPHSGSSIASLGTKLLGLVSPVASTSTRHIKHLHQGSEWLRDESSRFAPIIPDFEIINFYETYPERVPIPFIRGVLIVSQLSATLVGNINIALGKSHTELVRYEDRSDSAYQVVLDKLRTLVTKAPKVQISPNNTSSPAICAVKMGNVLSSVISGPDPLESIANPTAALVSDTIALPFSLPVQQNPKFVGRESHLKQLHDHLCKQNEASPGSGGSHARIAVLYGMGGAGKTQLSLAFAEQHQNDLAIVIWIDASSERSTLASYRAFAQRLLDNKTGKEARKQLLSKFHIGEYVSPTGHVSADANDLPKIAKCVVDFLQAENETFTWLMVMDSLDKLEDYPLSNYLPRSNQRGKVIITSRLTAVTRFGHPIEVDPIDEESGIQILLNAAYMRVTTDNDEHDAKRIAQTLGLLPLALEQAGAYISTRQMQLSKYLGLLERHLKELLDSPKGSSISGDQKSAFATFEVSFQRLPEDAGELLTLMSFLHNSSVWDGLFLPVTELGPRPQRQNSLMSPPHMHQSSDKLSKVYTDEIKLENCLGEIFSVSLAKRSSPDGTVYTNPLVHSWARERLSPEAQHQKLVQAITVIGKALEAAYTRPMTKDVLNFISKLAPHADHVVNLINQQGETVRDEIIFSTLLKAAHSAKPLYYLGVLFHNISRLKEAEGIYNSIISSSNEGSITPVMVANTCRRLAQIMTLYSRYTESEELLQAAIPVLESHLGKSHEDTVTALRELGMVYHRRHEYSKAERHLQEAIENGTNPMTGRMGYAAREAASILGLVYRHLGRLKEALDVATPALEQALAASQSSSTFDNPRSSMSFGQERPSRDSTTSREQGPDVDSAKTEEPQDQTLAHLYTLQYRHAILLQQLGYWNIAMATYHSVYSSLSSIVGANNPLTLRTANALGRIYCFLGHYKKSRDLLDVAWKGQQQLGFSRDAETAQLRTLFNIGVLNREEGLYEEAEECLGRVEVAYKRLFGQSGPGASNRDLVGDTEGDTGGTVSTAIPNLKFPVQDVLLEKAITLTYMARYYSPTSTVAPAVAPLSPILPGILTPSPYRVPQQPKNVKEERLKWATQILSYVLKSQEEHDKTAVLEHIITRTALAEAYLEYHTPEGLKQAEKVIKPSRDYVLSRDAHMAGMYAGNPIRLKVELVVVEILLASDEPNDAIAWINGTTGDGTTETSTDSNMIARLETAFGKQHQSTVRGKVLLARAYHSTGKTGDAKELAQKAVDTLKHTLGDTHPFTGEVSRLLKTWDPLSSGRDHAGVNTDAGGDGILSDGEGGIRRTSTTTRTGRFGFRRALAARGTF
ncbi:hypothetical protein QBC37DRAFT_386350 [Rhypophila decipiens]|uniref:NB-ARC domain-containing protein n=1 Tax=Rhypophila decipiens TaxID=261697 RepID=A0AAN7B953_9PEZI|nr:hypothetical protein QBC37DRAFT_386350 [Rhypophila decipiens]